MAAMPPVPWRFRRRLLIALLVTSLVPMSVVGVVSFRAVGRLLSVSLAPIEDVLDSAGEQLERCPGPPEHANRLSHARLLVAQLELTRQALVRVGPATAFSALALAGVLAALVAWRLGRSLAANLGLLATGMQQLSRGELDFQLPEALLPADDEVGFLMRAFNQLGRELKAQREQVRLLEKLTARQESARQLAHELRNPLTAMAMALGRLERIGPAAPPAADQPAPPSDALGLLKHQLQALKLMAQGFAEMGKLPAAEPQAVALGPLLEESCTLYQQISPVPIECQQPLTWWVHGDPHQLRRLFANLLKNATEASRPGDEPIRVTADLEGGRVRVRVTDGGEGISDALVEADLSRGVVSTKPGGSGLGLRISQNIAHDHGATLRLTRRTPKGACASVDLPRWEKPT